MPQKICRLKECKHEGAMQDISNFYRNSKSARDGYDTRCKDCVRKRQLAKYHEDPVEALNRHKAWRAKGGLEKMNAYQREWRKNNSTPERKLRNVVSNGVYSALKIGGHTKGGSTFAHLSYTPADLKEHIENQFDQNMSWDNYGTYWNIDHIIPQAALVYDSLKHPNFQKCWALTNLRPIECSKNSSKGSLYKNKRYTYKK